MSVSDISDVSDTSGEWGYASGSENSVSSVVRQPIDADEVVPLQSPASDDSLLSLVSDPIENSSGDDEVALSTYAEDCSPAAQPRRSAISYLNFMRDYNRRYGGIFRGQKVINVAAQQWRSMDSDQRNHYRNHDYRHKSSKGSYSQESSSSDDNSSATSLAPSRSDFFGRSVVKTRTASDGSLGAEDCFKKPEPCGKRKRKRSCGKKKRKKSSCGKRRRKKSACAKKRKKSKKSCGKRRRKPRKTC